MGKPRREGYLLIDHKFSPGIDPVLARTAGITAPTVGADRLVEFSTVMCCHCGTIVILNPLRIRARGYCARCDAYHCDTPSCGLECRNFEKYLDTVQKVLSDAEGSGDPTPDLGSDPIFGTVIVSANPNL